MDSTCEDCQHCALEENGYSEFTIEGTNVHCLLNAHPETPFDRWYGQDYRLKHAQTCPHFEPGQPIYVSMGSNDLTDEQQDRWYAYSSIRPVAYSPQCWATYGCQLGRGHDGDCSTTG